MTMKNSGRTWTRTRYSSLYRHKSDVHYARTTLLGKKTWRSLKTSVESVARAELEALLSGEESLDLRERIVAARDKGYTREQVAQRYGVSLGIVKKLLQQRRHPGICSRATTVPAESRSFRRATAGGWPAWRTTSVFPGRDQPGFNGGP